MTADLLAAVLAGDFTTATRLAAEIEAEKAATAKAAADKAAADLREFHAWSAAQDAAYNTATRYDAEQVVAATFDSVADLSDGEVTADLYDVPAIIDTLHAELGHYDFTDLAVDQFWTAADRHIVGRAS